ncbi:MAG: hypothetical protein AMXMBFR33_04830 [Candidatus Xenobia bacterium]
MFTDAAIQRTSSILIAFVLTLCLLSIACALYARKIQASEVQAQQSQRTAFQATDQLALSDFRRSDSLRALAATGEVRYLSALERSKTDPARTESIQSLKRLALTSEEQRLITQAGQKADSLAQLEQDALDAVAKKDLARAIAIVHSPEYESARASVTEPIAQLRQALDRRSKEQVARLSESSTLLGQLALGTQVLTVLTVLVALVFFYQRRVVGPVVALSRSIQALVSGQSATDIGYQRDRSEIGGLARAMEQLRQTQREAEHRRWVAASVTELTEDLHGAEQPDEFGRRALSRLVPLVGGGYGAFHLLDEADGRYHLTSGYSIPPGQPDGASFAPGSGLAGQAVLDRKSLVLKDLPADSVSIVSGLGQARPQSLAIIPIQTQERVVAALEIASLSTLTPEHVTLLEESAGRMALQLEIMQRNLRTRTLLEQVRLSDERTRLLLDSTSEGIFGVDIEGRIDFVNAAACDLLGHTAREMLGQGSHALMHHHHEDGSEYPVHECPMYAAYTRGEASRVDNEVLWRKDGTSFPVEYGATPIRKENSLCGAVVSFTDITERKRMEKELRHQFFLSDCALDLTRAGHWHVPLDGSGWYNSSERAARIFGDLPSPGYRYRVDEWAAHVFEGDEAAAKLTMENFNAAVAGTIPVYDAIYAYKRPLDGEIVWIHALGHVVKDSDGKPTDMYGVTQDITRIKRAEFELKATEEFYRSVLEGAPDGLMVVDQQGVIRLANLQSERLFGYEPGELVGLPVERLVPHEAQAAHPGLVQSFFRDLKAREMGSGRELRGLRKDGTTFLVEIGLSPLPVHSGRGQQVAVSIRDVSHKRAFVARAASSGQEPGA